MFKIGSQRLAWITITWWGLDAEGYQVKNEIEMQVELVDRAELKDQIDRENLDDGNALEFAEQRAKGWKGVGNAQGEPLPFTVENLRLLWEAPSFAVAWGAAYLNAWAGQGKVREKNSQSLPADGQATAP